MIEKLKESERGQLRFNGAKAPGFSSGGVRMLHSRELFADLKEVVIEHEGEHYRLRATRKGKLILTK